MQQTRWTVTLSYFHLLLEKVQPCSPSVQCFSSKVHSEDGQLIYTGSLARAVRGQSYTFPHQYIGAQQNHHFLELTLKLRTFFFAPNIKGCSNQFKDRCYIDNYWNILQLFPLFLHIKTTIVKLLVLKNYTFTHCLMQPLKRKTLSFIWTLSSQAVSNGRQLWSEGQKNWILLTETAQQN